LGWVAFSVRGMLGARCKSRQNLVTVGLCMYDIPMPASESPSSRTSDALGVLTDFGG